MKQIPLTRGLFALVDDEDFEWLSQFKWSAAKSGITYYAVRWVNGNNKSMHRIILNINSRNIYGDHINGNGLDNRRENIRICNPKENARNRGLNSSKTCSFKGVHWDKKKRFWCASIKIDYKTIFLGLFYSPEEAAIAYDQAAIKYHGEFAKINDIKTEVIVHDRIKIRRNNTSGFSGVTFDKRKNRFMAKIEINRITKFIGYFDTPEEAALAYNKKALELLGDKAKLNTL